MSACGRVYACMYIGTGQNDIILNAVGRTFKQTITDPSTTDCRFYTGKN